MSRAKSFSEETFEEAFEDTPLHDYLRLIVILVFVEKDEVRSRKIVRHSGEFRLTFLGLFLEARSIYFSCERPHLIKKRKRTSATQSVR